MANTLQESEKGMKEAYKDEAGNSNAIDFDTAKVKRMAKNAGREVRDFVHDTSEKASHYRQETEASISAHPLRAVAIAGAVGLALGALFLNRK